MKISKSAIIIEDEIDAQETLIFLLEKFCPEVKILNISNTIKDGLISLQTHTPDIVFLDIELSDGTGFDLLEKAGSIQSEVIFVTGNENYAIKAFNYSAIGYLLKPIDPDLLVAAVNKINSKIESFINERVDLLMNSYQKQEFTKIALPNQDSIEIVNTSDILYCEASDNYTFVHIKSDIKKVMISKNIGQLEKLLPTNFFRVHKSFLVNLQLVKRFLKTDGGELVLENNQHIPVAKRRKENLIEKLSNF